MTLSRDKAGGNRGLLKRVVRVYRERGDSAHLFYSAFSRKDRVGWVKESCNDWFPHDTCLLLDFLCCTVPQDRLRDGAWGIASERESERARDRERKRGGQKQRQTDRQTDRQTQSDRGREGAPHECGGSRGWHRSLTMQVSTAGQRKCPRVSPEPAAALGPCAKLKI